MGGTWFAAQTMSPPILPRPGATPKTDFESTRVLNDYCALVSLDYNRVRNRARLITQGLGRGRQQDLECHHRLF